MPLDKILTANARVLRALKAVEADINLTALGAIQIQTSHIIDAEVQHVEAFHAHARGIHDKCQSAVQLVDRALNLKHQRIAQEQTELMTKLAESTVDDSATVRVITVITLIYLSFTVVGVSLSFTSQLMDPADCATSGYPGYAILLSGPDIQEAHGLTAILDLYCRSLADDNGNGGVLAVEAGAEAQTPASSARNV